MQSSGVTVSHGHTSCSLEQRWQQHRAHNHHHFSFLCSFHTIYKQLKLQRIVTWDQHWPQWKENEELLKMQEINYMSNNTLESISIFLLTSLPPLARTSANFEPELKAQFFCGKAWWGLIDLREIQAWNRKSLSPYVLFTFCGKRTSKRALGPSSQRRFAKFKPHSWLFFLNCQQPCKEKTAKASLFCNGSKAKERERGHPTCWPNHARKSLQSGEKCWAMALCLLPGAADQAESCIFASLQIRKLFWFGFVVLSLPSSTTT